MRTIAFTLSLLALSGVALAQDPDAGSGWRREGQAPPPEQNDLQRQEPGALPAQLTIKPGTFVTVRVNDWLSSDRNQPGDAFSATLVQPVVVDGFVLAQRGQTVGGRVVEVQRAGRGEPVSRLGLQLTELTVADGQQVAVDSQLVSRTPPPSTGRNVGTIMGTTVAGAAVGAMAGRGVGAAIGALAGASAGVLLTRGRQTVVYPETVLTFRVESPVSVSTERAPAAFHQVDPERDYDRPNDRLSERADGHRSPPPPPCYSCGPYFYPYYYGPSISFFFGPRPYWGPGFYYGPRGYWRHGYRR